MSQRNEALFEIHGVSPEHTPEQVVAMGNAMLIALGSGGPLSAREMEEFVSIATEYGATPDAIDGWKRFDHASGKVSDHLQLNPRLARHMMYEAIRICSADAPPGPVAKLAGIARALGVDLAAHTSLEALVTTEGALRGARSELSATADNLKKGRPASATAAIAAITEQEGKLRKLRLSTMDTGKAAS